MVILKTEITINMTDGTIRNYAKFFYLENTTDGFDMDTVLDRLVAEAKTHHPNLEFRMLEVGALDVGHKEGFYRVLSDFPGSQILGFEVEETVCDEMNAKAPEGLRYFPTALGSADETRAFFETNHPMCSSLYEPNEAYLRLFNNLEVAYTKNNIEDGQSTSDWRYCLINGRFHYL